MQPHEPRENLGLEVSPERLRKLTRFADHNGKHSVTYIGWLRQEIEHREFKARQYLKEKR